MVHILLFLFTLFIFSCSSQPLLPEKDSLKVKRERPPAHCEHLGKVTGLVIEISGTREEALEELKQTAANKGANYLMVEQFSDFGTQVTGQAFKCPE